MRSTVSFLFIFFIGFLAFSQEDEDFSPPEIPNQEQDSKPFECILSYGPDAKFPGGYDAMKKFLEENIKFPDSLKWDLVKVYVRFTIESTGEVGDVRVVKSTEDCELCRAEAIRVVKSMPKWIPSQLQGKPIRSSFDLPITFKNES